VVLVPPFGTKFTPTVWRPPRGRIHDHVTKENKEERTGVRRDQTERIPKDLLRSEAFFKVNSFFSFRVYHPKKKLSASTLLYSFCKTMLRRMRILNFCFEPLHLLTHSNILFFYGRRIVCWSISLCICVLFTGLGHLKVILYEAALEYTCLTGNKWTQPPPSIAQSRFLAEDDEAHFC
jgi:hypothetical protein